MFKKLFFACAAILCLVLTYHFGATNAQGQGPSVIYAVGGNGAILTNGQIWVLNPGAGWGFTGDSSPVPIEEIAGFMGCYTDGCRIVATNGMGWIKEGSIWRNYALDLPTTIQPETWSGIKTKFNK